MPGSIAGTLLGDHGAEIVKIEPKGGVYFAHDLCRKGWDRGKLSIELDYENADDRKQIIELAGRSDVVIHSLSVKQANELGLDDAGLCGRYPGLVVCALSAYPQESPMADRPNGESLVAASLGVMVDKLSPFRDGPVYLGHPALHYGQAFLAVIDILAAIRVRRETGFGQGVEASLLDAFLAQSPMNNWWNEHGISYIKKGDSSSADRFGKSRLVTGMFECSDGQYLQMHTGGPGGFKTAMDVMGFGDRIQTITGPEMAVPLNDEEYHIARVELFDVFKQRPRNEWITLFQAADGAALPVLEPAEVLLDDQVEFVGQRIDQPDADFGTIHQAGPAVRFRSQSIAKPRPAPAPGAHNEQLPTLLARRLKTATKKSGRLFARPLEGLRILDFSSFFACGYGARLMSDLGADVIKVETPDGDQMRPLSNCFDACQRGKRDIVINLKSPEGLAIAYKLIETADVVMHNLRPGKADKIGLGYEKLAQINPRLIYAYLPGYGSQGPKSKLKSFAPLVSGWTGLLYEGGGEGNPPTRGVFGNEDYNNGFLGAVSVLMAIENRYKTGKGDYVECPQLHSSLFTSSEHFLDASKKPVYGMRLDKEQMGFNALDRLYRTRDGKFLCIDCRTDDRFAALAHALGRSDLVKDARFADSRARSSNDHVLRDILCSAFLNIDSMAAQRMLDNAGAAAEIARETSWLDEFFWAEWAQNSGRVIEDKNSIYGHVRMIGIVTRLMKTPGYSQGSAPRLGEHTRQILSQMGYGEVDIKELIDGRKVVVEAKKAAA
jgi:crotonobetainyl-CoA:carnitine CoA-transferase CaiB-like acyl-CoA transferase